MDLLNPAPQQAGQRQNQLWTANQLQQAHALAQALQDKALNSHPIYSPWEGASRMADALAGNIVQSSQANAEREQTGYTERELAKATGIPIPGQPSTALPSAPAPENANPPPGPVSQNEKDAIAANESGGNYGTIGPHVAASNSHPAGYAIGKYQVMNYDLPDRLAKAGLPSMTEQEFLANHDAQEKQFDHEFGGLRQNHSFADAASMWHSGVPYDQAVKQGRTDGYMTTQNYVQKALHNLNPVGTAQAASAPASQNAGVLTPEALAAHGQQNAPSFEGRFGNQPQTFDQGGSPLPQGSTPGTFDQRFQPMLPQTSPPPPQPPNPGPIAVPAKPHVPASAAAPAAPPGIPHVAVTPRPAGTGQPIPGTMSLQQQHAILNLIGQPATHELGLALAKQYLLPQETNAPTGYKYMGTPGAGYTPSQMPSVPQELPSVTGPFGAHAPSFLPGSRTPQVTIPTVGGAGADAAGDAVKSIIEQAQKLGGEHRKALLDWLNSH
ncbi:MAG TPA: hypothetical protein VGT08_01710 [Terracidiphilus sp.]|nr:hypothetical protein [Terracidiphilus sp.]